MAVFVYRRQPSQSARALATAVEGFRMRRMGRQGHRQPVNGDVVVCWGEEAPAGLPAGVQVINGTPLTTKFHDVGRLRHAGVSTIEVSRTLPLTPAATPVVDPAIRLWEMSQDQAGDFVELETYNRTPPLILGVRQLRDNLSLLIESLGRPAPLPVQAAAPAGTWVPRMNNHIGGNDLLHPPTAPDYYSRRLQLTDEYRIHSFDGRSIRAGRKVLRDGFSLTGGAPGHGTLAASPWIRSYDGGWRINYDGFESSRPMRDLAAQAVQALGLTFGAVDIGLETTGRLVVLEVNRAAGIEGGSTESYAHAITRWVAEHGSAEARRAAA